MEMGLDLAKRSNTSVLRRNTVWFNKQYPKILPPLTLWVKSTLSVSVPSLQRISFLLFAGKKRKCLAVKAIANKEENTLSA